MYISHIRNRCDRLIISVQNNSPSIPYEKRNYSGQVHISVPEFQRGCKWVLNQGLKLFMQLGK